MYRIIVPAFTTAAFMTIAVYSQQPTMSPQTQFVVEKIKEYDADGHATPVTLTSRTPNCGEDWLCLVSWAEQQHTKRR